ncbi:MAG: DegV family EDD domain-containing protein, partial [Lachnospiraceae bacterium]|nr:DegV family EDD domain-containing protein [Lachnospiraceae bacterium]
MGDERRLVQIVLNLLTNAVKYTEEGGVTVRVTSEKIGNNRVRIKIAVSDTGIGIEKKNIEHLFETYSQFDRDSNGNIEGNGLGLPIAYELTTLMGGKLTVDSVYGQGSTFTADLTLGFEGDDVIGGSTYEEISRQAADSSSYVRSFEAGRAKILVVDDDVQNRSIISGLLKDTKVEVTEAGSGEEALKLTALNEYHVILVDYIMPGMTGTEVLEAIRTQSGGKCRESSIIALTGANLDGRMHNNVLYDFDMVLTKPVEYTVLESAIADSLPEDLIDFREKNRSVAASFTSVMAKRKRRIRITTESICDIPEDLIKKYDIGIMYLYIKTANGRFMDTIEIDSSDLMGKLTESKREIVPDGATVKEYEDFFRKELESSEEIIHLSFSSKMGESCGRAMEAAKSFSHVHVIDSGLISSGLGLMAIIASGWTMSDRSVDVICEEIRKLSRNIELSFILPSAAIFAEYGRMAKKRGEIYDALNIHPAISISGGKFSQVRAYRGDMDRAISRHIKTTLALAGRMDRRVPVIVTHSGLSPRTQNNILREMKRAIPENMLMMT